VVPAGVQATWRQPDRATPLTPGMVPAYGRNEQVVAADGPMSAVQPPPGYYAPYRSEAAQAPLRPYPTAPGTGVASSPRMDLSIDAPAPPSGARSGNMQVSQIVITESGATPGLSEPPHPERTPALLAGEKDVPHDGHAAQAGAHELPAAPLPAGPALTAPDEKPPATTEVSPDAHSSKPLDPDLAGARPGEAVVGRPMPPAVRMVNSKRILLNYEVKDVGPSGVASVDLWYTQDGRTWHKHGTCKATPPYAAEVPDEGLYGFTLVAKSGLGMSKQPPQTGDLPQAWVEVDLTAPVVQVGTIKPGPDARTLAIQWTASDRNLGRRPITLSYGESKDGPWTPIAANLENSGRHVWQLPAGVPGRVFVRVEAADLVGNVGTAQTPAPVLIDMSQPSVSILNVESGSK
jgi:hypothetical protein